MITYLASLRFSTRIPNPSAVFPLIRSLVADGEQKNCSDVTFMFKREMHCCSESSIYAILKVIEKKIYAYVCIL